MSFGKDIFGRKFLVVTALAIAAAGLTVNGCSFGGNLSGERLARAEASPHYEDDAFFNEERPAPLGITWGFVKAQFFGDEVRVPPSAVPVVSVDPNTFGSPPTPGLRAIWFGHASVLIEIDGHRVMVDPVFSERASPVQFAGPKRFHPPPLALADLKGIDAVMISHDHYDHLDRAVIEHLAAQGTQFYVPLGVGAHLAGWGVPEDQINDMEWGQSGKVGELTIMSTPSRHYSGRGVFDYKETLWSSWSVLGPQHRMFYSGDTGYSKLFGPTGENYGPFDLAIIKVGAYGPGKNWLDIHMTPEDAIRVHKDVKGKRMLPVHWATFNMGHHAWDEPIKRALAAAREHGVDLVTPRVGEVVVAGEAFPSQPWWEAVK